ncbi:2-oxoglutarate-dependent dioxygenase DAO-like isoform X4 [Camellia sinensis]|nr:2-oxoglutarate-dependent dioxygenase DAO-like isoform X4 [Camellia sinensis]
MARNSLCAVPVIDLEVFPGQSRKMIEACEELGCFRIINHHKFLPPALSSEMKAVARSLMELSAEIKRRNKGVIRSSGYEEPTQFNPYFEALGLYDMASAQAVDAFCTQLDASPHQRYGVMEEYAM